MTALNTKRQANIEVEREDILRTSRDTTSKLTAMTDRVAQYAALMLDDVLNGKGDFDADGAEKIITLFEDERIKIAAQLAKLNDISALRKKDQNGNIDGTATAAALNQFMIDYNLDIAAISAKFDPI